MHRLLIGAGLGLAALAGSSAMAVGIGTCEGMIVRSNGVELATQTFGAEDGSAVFLVMGATASMLGWPEGFCGALAARGLSFSWAGQ